MFLASESLMLQSLTTAERYKEMLNETYLNQPRNPENCVLSENIRENGFPPIVHFPPVKNLIFRLPHKFHSPAIRLNHIVHRNPEIVKL